MSLVACKECGKEVSDKAQACPGCGAPMGAPAAASPKKEKRKTSPVAWAALVAIIGALWWYSQSRGYKEQSLPKLPIEVGYRSALTGPGMVLHVENKSAAPLMIMVKLTNPTTRQENSFRLDVKSKGAGEIGYKEGWTLATGDKLEIRNDAYQTWIGSIPALK